MRRAVSECWGLQPPQVRLAAAFDRQKRKIVFNRVTLFFFPFILGNIVRPRKIVLSRRAAVDRLAPVDDREEALKVEVEQDVGLPHGRARLGVALRRRGRQPNRVLVIVRR